MIAAAVVAAAVAGSVALRLRRPKHPDPSEPVVHAVVTPAALPASGGSPSDASRSLVRMAVAAGIVVALAILTVVVTRPSNLGTPRAAAPSTPPAFRGVADGSASPMPPPMTLADCQAAIAAELNPPGLLNCGYETAGWDRAVDEPSADPADPRYAGAALPTGLSTGDRICVAGPERPVLDTAPTLSASFTAVPGLRRIASTFQLTGVYGRTGDDMERPGDYGDPLGATLDLSREGPLERGQSYRWRVRGTPPGVGAGGWSPWCEFTIAEPTPGTTRW